jgi:alpha-galactosidase
MTASQSGTHWVSDEVGNNYNLGAVFGATYLFPPETCLHWTCHPNNSQDLPLDLEAQFAANMMGHFGFSEKIYRWDEQTRKVCARQVALYKKIRPILREADVYHLTSQASMSAPNSIQASLYVDSKSGKAVLFAFQGGAESLQCRLALRGLSPKKKYRFQLGEGASQERIVPGRELIERGIDLAFPHRGASAIVILSSAK